MVRVTPRIAPVACLGILLHAAALWASDWPAYQHDPGRSAVTADALQLPMSPAWTYEPAQAPAPAWPQPGKELHRMDFDYAFEPVVAGGTVYFGSSADDTLRAVDAATGRLLWRFTTDGPIRFAPAVARGKVYVASDDGCLYAVAAATGSLAWRFRGAPAADKILGNGRMISRWPCRSGPLVVDDTVYFTAGMWPANGVYVYALEAETGKEVWCNDSSGDLCVTLPHPGAAGFSGVAPQGYLLARGDRLLVTTGRSIPAAFDRRTGRLLYYKPSEALYHGGAWVTSGEDLYFNPANRTQNPSAAFVGEADPVAGDGVFAYSFVTGEPVFELRGKYRVLPAAGVMYAAGQGTVDALDLAALRRSGKTLQATRWSAALSDRVYSMALAGATLLLGGPDRITALDSSAGKTVWSAPVEGQVRGLAVAGGRLVASTHRGRLYCFADRTLSGSSVDARVVEHSQPTPVSAETCAAAKDLVRKSGKTEGYALILGQPNADLAEALAESTKLHVVGMVNDPQALARQRQRLLDVGLYGNRVHLLAADDPSRLPVGPYFAELVVVAADTGPRASAKECYRALRPCGGALCLVGLSRQDQQGFARDAGVSDGEFRADAAMIVRGPLPGAGEWRYPWADGGRSGVGTESLVHLPLSVLWFGGPGPDRLMDRHWMGSPSLSVNGRVFQMGEHHLIAFDAYTGRELWNREFRELGRKYSQYYSSNMVADARSVFVVRQDRCCRLDQVTGQTTREYPLPQSVVRDTPSPQLPEYLDVAWPRVWNAVGPFPPGEPPLSAEQLRHPPAQVTVQGREYTSVVIEAPGQTLDFARLFRGDQPASIAKKTRGNQPSRQVSEGAPERPGRIAYAWAPLRCPRAGTLLIGTGADGLLQWFVDGRPVFSNVEDDVRPKLRGPWSKQHGSTWDRVFEVQVTAGEHVVAAMVQSGNSGWAMGSASIHAADVPKTLPVVTGDPNIPNLRDLSWGYLSVADDLLLGSYAAPIAAGQSDESQLIARSESKALFAVDQNDGSLRWVYRPSRDRTISHIEIAFGDGRLFLVEASSKADAVRARRRGETPAVHADLVALNLSDGRLLWRQSDVPVLPYRWQETRIYSNPQHLFMGLPDWGHLVYAQGVVVVAANAAYDALSGKKLWQQDVHPRRLPVVFDEWLVAQPYAYQLRTGVQRTTSDPLTGRDVPWSFVRAWGCGPVNGCRNLLFFRSGADGMFDMTAEAGTNFGGVRPNCTRSLLAANGLLIHPEGYSGCCCSYNYQTSLAMISAAAGEEAWYAFPGHGEQGPIRHVALNFGAPGDRRDDRGTAWLSFPRPVVSDNCPASATLSLNRAERYYHRRSTPMIQGTGSPWIYSSGLSGQGHIDVDLAIDRGLTLPEIDESPTIDGIPNEACWQRGQGLRFEHSPFSMLAASVELRMFRDSTHVYFGYSRRPLAHALSQTPESTLAQSDALEIYLTDYKRRAGLHLIVGRDGQTSARLGKVDRYRRDSPAWKGDWQSAVRSHPDQWTAEAAIPLQSLRDAGIDPGRLQINCLSKNLTAVGLEALYLTDPHHGTDFERCVQFSRIERHPAASTPARTFTVRLHFAETEPVAPGQRVFRVALQGKTVVDHLDVVREAGAQNRALVKEYHGVAATDRMVIDLQPVAGAAKPVRDPMISGVEIVAER